MTTLQDIELALDHLAMELANPQWDSAVPALHPATDVPFAKSSGIDPAAVPLPLLHACRRRWGVPQGWRHGYCPICGAWPGFAEVCGVERNRYLRCLRCGAAWPAQALVCVYCGIAEHAKLGSLVPEHSPATWTIEVCYACRGYLKAFTALRPCAPEKVLPKDLQTVELDLAACERGYHRPYSPHVAA